MSHEGEHATSSPEPPRPPADLFLAACPTCRMPLRACRCLFDIRDPSAFVHDAIKASGRYYDPDERMELHAEGVVILQQLAARFEPHREGYEHAGRFSGFAAKYLRLKLEDAYHRLHPSHSLKVEPDGTRRWHYAERAVSLEALMADEPDRHDVLMDRRRRGETVGGRLHQALYERWCREVKIVVRAGELWAEGATDADVSVMLGITPEQVKDIRAQIEPVLPRLLSEDP